MAALLLVFPAAAEIYKVVHPDGTVEYTDQAPQDNAEPLELPPITTIRPQRVEPRENLPPSVDVSQTAGARYGNFQFLEPAPDQTYWNTGGTVNVRLGAATALEPNHQMVLYLNNEAQPAVSSLGASLDGLVRGEYTVRAEIVDRTGTIVATAGPVVFYVKQASRLNRPG